MEENPSSRILDVWNKLLGIQISSQIRILDLWSLHQIRWEREREECKFSILAGVSR